MLSEHQPYTLDYCYKCGAQAVYCDDWDHVKWVDGDPDCLHEIKYEDSELAAIDEDIKRIDEILDRIQKVNSLIEAIDTMPVQRIRQKIMGE